MSVFPGNAWRGTEASKASGMPEREGQGMVVLEEVGRQEEASPRAPAGLRSPCLGWWGHTGRDRSWDGVRRDRGCRAQTGTGHEPPALSQSLVWGFSPRGFCPHGLLGGESSVVWIHASNAGWFWDTQEPGCCFWVTCEVLCGTIKILRGPGVGQGPSPCRDTEAEVVAAGWRLGAINPCLGEPGRETQSAGIIQLQSQKGAA